MMTSTRKQLAQDAPETAGTEPYFEEEEVFPPEPDTLPAYGTNEEPCPETLHWLACAIKADIRGSMDGLVDLVASAPEEARMLPDFGYLAGFTLGRIIVLDSRGEDGRTRVRSGGKTRTGAGWFDRIAPAIRIWTAAPPIIMAMVLTGLDPRSLFALLAAWPHRMLAWQPFYLGVFSGICAEVKSGDPVAARMDGISRTTLATVGALLRAHRRPGASPENGTSLL